MTKPWLIHVVDDDEPVRNAFVFALQAVGFRTVTYVDSDDFLARGREERAILISDVRMAGMNGIELTRPLRRDGSAMPIILVTGHADGELQADAMSAGGDLVLGKPVELVALVAEIARMTTDWSDRPPRCLMPHKRNDFGNSNPFSSRPRPCLIPAYQSMAIPPFHAAPP